MRTMLGVLKRLMIVVLGSVLLPVAATGATPNEHPTVTTLSGTGALGSRDGRDATYALPVGVAFDGAGRLYVADAAAQRIRVVERDGTTRTFAGPDGPVNTLVTAGGYVDGPARSARFNWPLGVAVGEDGAVYVADSNNNCIRRIGQNGIVSTFTGQPGVLGAYDGPATLATFGLPTGIAASGKDLYVADRYGIRKVAADGSVTTLRGLGQNPWAVAVRQRPAGPVVMAADRNGIVARYYVGPEFVERRFASPQAGVDSTPQSILGDRVIGNAFGLTALDDYTVVYTDPRTESVRLLELVSGETKVLAGSETPDGAADDAAFADGPWDVARFFAPAGIARSDDGRIVVADAGNRRIRLLSTFSRPYDPWRSVSDSMYQANDSDRTTPAYRIAFVGNSQVYSDTNWSDSIENVLQQRLEQKLKPRNPIRIVPALAPGVTIKALQEFADAYSDAHLFEALIFQVNTGTLPDYPDSTHASRVAAIAQGFQALNKPLAAAHIPLLVVCEPFPAEFSPAETFWRFTLTGGFFSSRDAERYAEIVEAAVQAGVPYLDLGPVYRETEASAVHRALFGSTETHFSENGRYVTGNAIADFILRDPARWIVETAHR
jgi:hypothetical protein